MMYFAGVVENNFDSVLRRGLVWEPKCRFFDERYLRQHYPDHELNGVFPKKPEMKARLTSGSRVAAAIQIQHTFEMDHNTDGCEAIIENYAALGGDGGLTEDTLRDCCGLQKRTKGKEYPLAQLASAASGIDVAPSGLGRVAAALRTRLLDDGRDSMTWYAFNKFRLPEGSPPIDRNEV